MSCDAWLCEAVSCSSLLSMLKVNRVLCLHTSQTLQSWLLNAKTWVTVSVNEDGKSAPKWNRSFW